MASLILSSVLWISFSGQWAEEKEALQKQYDISQYIEHYYEAPAEELEASRTPFEKSVNRRFEQAMAEYQDLLKAFPQSPEVHADYIFFLDRRGRFRQAAYFAEESIKKFPNDLRLKIMAESYKKISESRSRQARAELKQEMDARLAAWTQLVLEKRKKR